MAFNWMAFAGGAARRGSEILGESRQEAKQYEAEQRAAAERNMATISRRRAVADQVTGYTTYLKQNGVTDAQLQAVISSGPKAIQDLTSRVESAVQANNNRPLGVNDAQALVNMPEGFSPVDMTMDQFVRSTYGLSTPAAAAPEEKVGLLGTILGGAEMGRARERLGRTEMAEGMTIQQINAAARAAEYESLIPGTFATITGAEPVYSSTETGVEFAKDALALMKSVKGSQAWLVAGGQSTEDKDGTQLQLEVVQENLTPMIRGNIERYGEKFLKDQEAFIRTNLGDTYMDNLLSEYGVDQEEAEPVVDTTAVDSALQEALGVEGYTTPGIVTTELPPAEPAVLNAEGDVLNAEGTVGGVTTADTEVPSSGTAVRNAEGDVVTYKDWQGMSRQERKDMDLPTSVIGGQMFFNQFQASLGLADADTGERIPVSEAFSNWFSADTPDGKGREVRAAVEQDPVYKAMSEQGVDDNSIALLQSHGSDMLQYALDKGVTNEEELVIALTEWGRDNNIVMPFDKSALVFAIKQVVDSQEQ
jgi:hypothetical protein